ncbi:MAG: hypothetical protein KGM44_08000 [bacterium]|nr:hypothetical protein [bacterium]
MCADHIFAGSVLPLHLPHGTSVAVLGPGSIAGDAYVAPAQLTAPAEADLIVSRGAAVNAQRLELIPAPPLAQTLASVDADCGVTLYDRRTLQRLGTFATAGSPADAAYDGGSLIWAPSSGSSGWRYTPGDAPAALELGPNTSALLAIPDGTVVQANRDLGGGEQGALTVLDGAQSRRIAVGRTPEGLAPTRDGLVLVSLTNDDRIAAVDPHAGGVVRTLSVGQRPFGIAVDGERGLAFVALNSIARMAPSQSGGVVAVDLRAWRIARVRHDARLALGVALDRTRGRLFLTEELGTVLVLDEELRSVHAALHPCALPWLPTIDPAEQRLFVPCPRENRVIVYDLATLREVARMATSPYPLRVAVPGEAP